MTATTPHKSNEYRPAEGTVRMMAADLQPGDALVEVVHGRWGDQPGRVLPWTVERVTTTRVILTRTGAESIKKRMLVDRRDGTVKDRAEGAPDFSCTNLYTPEHPAVEVARANNLRLAAQSAAREAATAYAKEPSRGRAQAAIAALTHLLTVTPEEN